MTGSQWAPEDVPDLTGRRALVTGATSGIGEALVTGLARHGAEVVLAARNELKLTATAGRLRRDVPGAVVRSVVLDLADLSSVRRAADRAAGYGPLHLLVNNAGVMATPYVRTVDGFELQMATNVLGPFALTGLLWPLLVAGGAADAAARVVAVSSQAHRAARSAPLRDPLVRTGRYHRWSAYAETKLADLLLAFELDRRARASGAPVTGLAAHPGLAATGLMASGQRRHPGGTILDAAFSVVGQAPGLGALPLLMAATADLPGSTYVGPGGPGELRGLPQIVGASRVARDPEVAAAMWATAQHATGVTYP